MRHTIWHLLKWRLCESQRLFPAVHPARQWALWSPCIFHATSISSCLFWCLCFSVYFGLQWSLTAWGWGSAFSPDGLTDTWEGGHSAISSHKNLSSSSPSPCPHCSGQHRQLWAVTLRTGPWVDLGSSYSWVPLTMPSLFTDDWTLP